MVIARKQTLVQLTDELVEMLDQKAASEGRSRSAVIREAIEDHLRDEYDPEVARQYAEAYARVPEQAWEVELAEDAANEMLRSLEEEEGDDSW